MIFYGTPHKGSPLANLGTNFFYIWFPTIEVQELSYTNKDYLDELNKHFGKLVGKGLQSLSFAELKVTHWFLELEAFLRLCKRVCPLASVRTRCFRQKLQKRIFQE